MSAVRVKLIVEFEIKPAVDALPDWDERAIREWYTGKQLRVVGRKMVDDALDTLRADGYLDAVDSGRGELEEALLEISGVSVRLAPAG